MKMTDIKKFKIADGISLNYINDKKYKTVSISLYLHRKLKRDEVTKNALLTSVLRQGTKKYPTSKEINRYTEELYGASYGLSVFKKGNIQTLSFGFNSLTEKYSENGIIEKCFDLLFEFLLNPLVENGGFVKKNVDTEKINLEADIKALINDKRAYADVKCLENMCIGEDSALSDIGYVEDLENIDEKNLYEHYKTIITQSPVDIFIVGDVDIDKIKAYLEEVFSKVNLDITPLDNVTSKKSANEEKYVEEKLDVAQGKLSIGLRTNTIATDDDYYPLVVGNSIFGSGAHSKLFNNVREKLSLAYYAYSRLDKFNGIMLIGSGIEFVNFNKAKDEIFVQLEATKNGEFTSDELFIAKQAIINRLKSYYDSPALLKDYYLCNILLKDGDSIEDAIEKVKKVTKEEIVAVFSKIKSDTVYFLKGKE
ncbi:MAG: insulinase family protein [Ruminococcaceae bacterium]|nr:insulinase family protein [Oscillospiraceae bacterium]